MKDIDYQSIKFYEDEADTYDERRWSTVAGKYIDGAQKDIVLELLGDCKGKNILDIATGTGRFALELAQRGAYVTVLDSSEKMLSIVKSKFDKKNLSDRLTIRKGTATELPFEDQEFDACICINAMNHIPEFGKVLIEIGRVTRMGGVSVTNYTNWLSYYLPFGVWVNLRQKSVTRNVYTKWFWLREIRSAHKYAGLNFEKVTGSVQFPTKTSNRTMLTIFKTLDKFSRQRLARYLAPTLFIRGTK